MRAHLPRSISIVTALGTALVLVVSTVGTASAEAPPAPSRDAVIEGAPPAQDPDVIGFVVTGETTIEDVVNSIVVQEGKQAAAEFFAEAADKGINFPGLSANSSDELQEIADSLTRGVALDPDVAGLTIGGSTPTSDEAAPVAPTASGLVGTEAIGPGVKTNRATANGAAWLMRDYLAYIECRVGPLFCSIVDRVDFRFTIDPGTRTTRISEQFNRFGNRKISKHVTVKAQLYSVGKYRATDYDEWSTPGSATQWLRTPSSQGGRKVKFKMTFTALTPVGVVSGTGSTAYTRACSKTDCRWPS